MADMSEVDSFLNYRFSNENQYNNMLSSMQKMKQFLLENKRYNGRALNM